MKILVTGCYNPEYNRTMVLLKGLRALGVELIEMPITGRLRDSRHEIKQASLSVDFIFMPSFTHADVRGVKTLTAKPVIFDPLISKYLTKVFDYKQVSRFSPRAIKNFYKDKFPFHKADFLLADTYSHKDYFVRTFNLDEKKVGVVPVGVDSETFFPLKKRNNNNNDFVVGFYGGFIPLQGVSNILSAAEILKGENLIFELTGSGFEFEKSEVMIRKKRLDNVRLLGSAAYNMLPDRINSHSVCLGIFGETPKAQLVIPNKVYHYAACEKCIITKDTPAIREVFTDKKDVILTSSDPKSIAEAILYVKKEEKIRDEIAASAHKHITENYNHVEIGRKFMEAVSGFF
ncbi:MAG: glycosyltransferase [Cyclobacteriaceae bacterium]|nr:glycosyltransferase [Cyclobacteriaceae bacterium]